MNRILAAIGRVDKRCQEKQLTMDKVEALSKSLDMTLDEFCKFQEYKSEAFASGKLSFEEAQFIYNSVGESVDKYNELPMAYKVVFNQIFCELLERHLRSYV